VEKTDSDAFGNMILFMLLVAGRIWLIFLNAINIYLAISLINLNYYRGEALILIGLYELIISWLSLGALYLFSKLYKRVNREHEYSNTTEIILFSVQLICSVIVAVYLWQEIK